MGQKAIRKAIYFADNFLSPQRCSRRYLCIGRSEESALAQLFLQWGWAQRALVTAVPMGSWYSLPGQAGLGHLEWAARELQLCRLSSSDSVPHSCLTFSFSFHLLHLSDGELYKCFFFGGYTMFMLTLRNNHREGEG